jgi:ATP-dependent Clp protease protease subunit
VADILDTVKETIVNAYVLKTGASREHISELMDDETYMSAKRALKEGFVDAVTSPRARALRSSTLRFPE